MYSVYMPTSNMAFWTAFLWLMDYSPLYSIIHAESIADWMGISQVTNIHIQESIKDWY